MPDFFRPIYIELTPAHWAGHQGEEKIAKMKRWIPALRHAFGELVGNDAVERCATGLTSCTPLRFGALEKVGRDSKSAKCVSERRIERSRDAPLSHREAVGYQLIKSCKMAGLKTDLPYLRED
jgi:hypothetical protein